MNQQVLYIAFDGQPVAVRSDVPEVLADLKRSFRQMLTSARNDPVAQLEVCQKGGSYQLRENNEIKTDHGSLQDVLQSLKYDVAFHLILSRPDLLWLHAGAVAYQGKVLILSGASGRGKSTLVANLCAHGWTYLADDIIPVDPDSGKVYPFPQTPMVRVNGGREVPRHRLPELKKTEVSLKPAIVCQAALPIGAVVFPEYGAQSWPQLAPCSPATGAVGLIEHNLNFVHHYEAAVDYICELVKRIPAFQLSFKDGVRAAELVTQICEEGDLFTQVVPKVAEQ
jgi:hypothetical protein